MKAIVLDKKLKFDIDYPLPTPGKNESLVKVLASGICNTDIELIRGYMGFKGILGHEFVGVVKKSDRAELIEQRVVGEINISCGNCYFCRNKMSGHCYVRSVVGILKRNGVFAEYVTIPTQNLHILPDEVSNLAGVFVEPLAAAFEIPEQVHIKPTDKVIVFGDGKLGLLCAQVVSLITERVTVVGKHSEKLALLKGKGIRTRFVDEFEPHRTKGDVVIECTGNKLGLVMAMYTTRPRGTLVIKSTTREKREFDLNHLVVNEINIVGSRCGPFPAAINALAKNKISVEPMITKKCSIEDGIESLRKPSGIKTVITMF